ncbi:MAG TPA: rhamnogalacturonan acetylesterase [Verrucomicrobiota bacterium]|nr:rhamnogalacturonan acetylesterase [Verrucomicrobiota bacterium]
MNLLIFNRATFALLIAAAFSLLAGCNSVPRPPSHQYVPEPNQTADMFPRPATRADKTKPALFIVGDSTVHNAAPEFKGWADVIAAHFDTNRITIENHARPGRSSRTFQTQGWWKIILDRARPGDFVVIQMGHNDASPVVDTNRARGTLPGIGDESKTIYNPVTRKSETVHTYGWYLRKYIADARAKGMMPILCSPVPRLPKQNVTDGMTETNRYAEWSREVAGDANVAFVDLNRLIMNRYVGMTPAEIKASYYTTLDSTHSNLKGAELNAECFVEGLRKLTSCSLKEFFWN